MPGDNELRQAARELLEALDGNMYPTHRVIDSSVIREHRESLRTALAAPTPEAATVLSAACGAGIGWPAPGATTQYALSLIHI